MIYKYYGPPGTGKTYRLISRAKAYIRIGTPLDKIGYFAFTKKAAGEAKERMSPVSPRRLSYFRTLHSLGFDCLDNINQDNVMQPYHYEDFGKKVNLQVKYYDRYNSDESFYLGFDNPYFQIIHKAVNRCVTLREQFDLEEHDTKNVNWKTLKHIHDNLLVYKDKKNLFDFNDMIKMLVDRSDKIPNFDVVFIDEAQDLSPLQWRLYDILKAKTKDIYLAGDDAKGVEGIDKMIDRCKAYIDAGAEIIFPEALQDEKDFEKVRKELSCYLLANMTEFGKSKLFNYKELENFGYNIVIYPVTTQRLAMKNVEDGLRDIFVNGHQNNIIDKMQTRKRLYELVEYEKYNSLDEKIYNFSTEGHE